VALSAVAGVPADVDADVDSVSSAVVVLVVVRVHALSITSAGSSANATTAVEGPINRLSVMMISSGQQRNRPCMINVGSGKQQEQ
jgi:hypothetical protein